MFIDYVFDNGNYYGFMSNYTEATLSASISAIACSIHQQPPTLEILVVLFPPPLAQKEVQVIKQNGNWFAIIVGGIPSGRSTQDIEKLRFGANIGNPTPLATNWGNIGGMDQLIDLHLYEDGGHWYSFTLNLENNSITPFRFHYQLQ